MACTSALWLLQRDFYELMPTLVYINFCDDNAHLCVNEIWMIYAPTCRANSQLTPQVALEDFGLSERSERAQLILSPCVMKT